MGVMTKGKEEIVGWFNQDKATVSYENELLRTIDQHKKQLYRIAYSYVKNEQDALDVIQETVCKALANQHTLKEPAFMKSWLIRILINCALDICKRSAKVQNIAPDVLENQFSEDASNLDELIDLRNAIEALGEPQKTLIQLRFYEDLTLEETARVMEMPLGTVKSHIYRTLNRLKLELREVALYE